MDSNIQILVQYMDGYYSLPALRLESVGTFIGKATAYLSSSSAVLRTFLVYSRSEKRVSQGNNRSRPYHGLGTNPP